MEQQTDLARVCRGLSHELSNILTFLLPALADAGRLQALMPEVLRQVDRTEGDGGAAQGALAPLAAALRRLSSEFDERDIERMGRQLDLAGGRLSLVFRDLRRGYASVQPGTQIVVDLWEVLGDAVRDTDPPAVVTLCHPEAPYLVRADPALLGEALRRVLRAAVGWSRMGHPQPAIRARLRRREQEAEVRVVLLGEPERLPPPDQLLEMLCPGETGALRAERGLLGVMLAEHLLAVHGGGLSAARVEEHDDRGVAFLARLPLVTAGA